MQAYGQKLPHEPAFGWVGRTNYNRSPNQGPRQKTGPFLEYPGTPKHEEQVEYYSQPGWNHEEEVGIPNPYPQDDGYVDYMAAGNSDRSIQGGDHTAYEDNFQEHNGGFIRSFQASSQDYPGEFEDEGEIYQDYQSYGSVDSYQNRESDNFEDLFHPSEDEYENFEVERSMYDYSEEYEGTWDGINGEKGLHQSYSEAIF